MEVGALLHGREGGRHRLRSVAEVDGGAQRGAPGANVLNADATVQDNSRIVADLSGFTPNSLATIQFSQDPIEVAAEGATKDDDPAIQGRYWISEDGTAHLTMPVKYRAIGGKYLFRVTDVDGRFIEQIVEVDSPRSGIPPGLRFRRCRTP